MGVVGGPDSIVTDGLIFYIDPANSTSFVTGSGTVTDMISGVTGVTASATHLADNAGIFDVNGGSLNFAAASNFFAASGSFSVSMWLNYDDAPAGYADSPFNIESSGTWTKGFGFVNDNVLGNIRWYIKQYNQNQVTTSVTVGQWHNLVGTWDGSTLELFRDGISIGTDTFTGGITEASLNLPLKIGRAAYSGGQMDGKFSTFMIYNRRITAAEALQNYNALKDRFV